MTANEMRDPMLRLLARLPLVEPPAALDQGVRSRCHVILAKQQRLVADGSEFATVPARLMSATLAIMAGVYGAAAALEALRLAGML